MFKILVEGCTPTRGSKYSACIDLYSSEDVVIGAGETKLVGLGVCIDIYKLYTALTEVGVDDSTMLIKKVNAFKSKHYLQLMLRSSLGKKGLILPNGVGVIDLDYKDEIKMIIHRPSHRRVVDDNDFPSDYLCSNYDFNIQKGDRIAQITLLEHKGYLMGIESDAERAGGFGSTGE